MSLALATICFTHAGKQECHPVLVGQKNQTPSGEFLLSNRRTESAGYGGDILQFHETGDTIYAVHRIWLLNPQQRRSERIKSANIKDRFISAGCINVDPLVYKKLVDCCSNTRLFILE